MAGPRQGISGAAQVRPVELGGRAVLAKAPDFGGNGRRGQLFDELGRDGEAGIAVVGIAVAGRVVGIVVAGIFVILVGNFIAVDTSYD